MDKFALLDNEKFRRAIKFVAVANLLYFFIEMYFALSADSVSLFADSIDFLEDASVNLLILLALNWSAKKRSWLGTGLAFLLLIPSLLTLFTAFHKLYSPLIPNPEVLSLTGLGALAVNGVCAFRLAAFRHHEGSLTKAAFLSARNDVYANSAIIVAGLITAYVGSYWPDLLVGIAIAVMNASAAKDILAAARKERGQMNPKA